VADNASGFVDFNQFNELNADEEARMFEQAMAEAEAATEREKTALRLTKQDASGSLRGPNGRPTAMTDDISKTASYSDYLQAKRDAAAAWAKLSARSRDPLLASVQGAAMTPEQRAAAAGADAAAQAREDGAAGEVKSGYEANLQAGAKRAAWEKAQADAAAKRADDDKQNKQTFYDKIYRDLIGGQWEGDFAEGMNGGDIKQRSRWLNTGVEAGDWSPPREKMKGSIYRQAWGRPGGRYYWDTGLPVDDEKGGF